jgi:non-heme chloroperoxidase
VRALFLAILCTICAPAQAESREFTSSDGVRLHYLDQGAGETLLLFVPGWLMPAGIWRRQLDHFSRDYRVVAFDPRSQGASQVTASGNNVRRRAEDLHELIEHLRAPRVVLVGWSLGVLEALLYVNTRGDERLAALVLVDNSVGEMPPQKGDPEIRYGATRDRRRDMALYVGALFRKPQPPAYLEWLTTETLRAPPEVGVSLLAIPYARSFWRTSVYQTRKPLLYVVTASLDGQARTLHRKRSGTSIEVFTESGHALFVDDHERFNHVLQDFLQKTLAP